MAKEEVFLPVQMERLEIEPQKVSASSSDENPFVINRSSTARRLTPALCACSKRSVRKTTPFKRNTSKLIKEPVLKFIQEKAHSAIKPNVPRFPMKLDQQTRSPLQTLNLEALNICELVKDSAPSPPFSAPSFQDLQRPEKREISTNTTTGNSSATERNRGAGPSCSQQALNPQCDITIDELASYFETLVHIPKKMSSMAEMMYI